MRKRLITIFFATALINSAYSVEAIKLTSVPFQNVNLNAGQKVQASYSFGSQFVIFCFASNTDITGSITWPYQGRPQSSTLPVLLKISDRFEGQWADANGTIQITNTTGSPMQVGCLFAY